MGEGKRDVTERIYMADAFVERRNRKERVMGGMVLGIKEMIERDKGKEIERGEGWLSKKICLDGEWWRVVGVYVNRDLDKKLDMLGRVGGRKEEESGVIGGRGF